MEYCLQINLIIGLLGTPTEKIWKGLNEMPALKDYNLRTQPYNKLKGVFEHQSSSCLQLLNALFTYDPHLRISAQAALNFRFMLRFSWSFSFIRRRTMLLSVLLLIQGQDPLCNVWSFTYIAYINCSHLPVQYNNTFLVCRDYCLLTDFCAGGRRKG